MIQIINKSMGSQVMMEITDPTAQGHDWYMSIIQGDGQRVGMPLSEFKQLATMALAFNSKLH